MTPKEKAKELVDKMYDSHGQYADIGFYEAVLCAHIAVDEMISLANVMDGGFSFKDEIIFLQEVKQEIETFNTK